MSGLLFILPLIAAALLSHALPARWVRPLTTAVGLLFAASYGIPGFLVLSAMGTAAWLAARVVRDTMRRHRRLIAIVASAAILTPLVFAKDYLGLATPLASLLGWSTGSAAEDAHSAFVIVGLSFYSFRALALLLDAYHGRLPEPPSLRDAALYLFFFPQFLAGPIERPAPFFAALSAPRSELYRQLADGIILITVGVFMKVVIADRLALYTDAVFSNPSGAGTVRLWLGMYLYAVQLYCDFSGYTNIAIGLSLMLGFRPAVNFRQPYMATSIADFWTRWHISLSFWLRDFVFLPIAYASGRRAAPLLRTPFARDFVSYAAAASVTMVLCGLWHGAGGPFLLWGLLHGAYLTASRSTKKLRQRVWTRAGFSASHPFRRFVAVFITFHLVSLAWVIFRSESFETARGFLSEMISLTHMDTSFRDGLRAVDIYWSMMFAAMIGAVQYLQERKSLLPALAAAPIVVRWAIYILLVLAIETFVPVYGLTRFAYVVF
ncbi:MAG: MBOAT family protein [Ignavibacteriae bacterium]|nr:MBOAT family protein [Ignavibacteriota bacterium]